jgi:hypothetical protein
MNIFTIALIGVTAFSSLTAWYQHSEALTEKYKNEALRIQLDTIKKIAEATELKFVNARKSAAIEMENRLKVSNDVLKEKIPAGCTAAINWGIDQAGKINE